MTSDSHWEESYSNDFEIIDEPNEREINTGRNRGVSCASPHTMASREQTVRNASTVSRNRNMDPNYEIHSKREAAWYKEKEKLLQKIKNLESELEEKSEELSEIRKQKINSIEENEKYTALESKYTALESKYIALESKNEEMESKYEEMKSKNEEMKSKNEEMKSKHEEMESKNEEMKSKNEEMESKNEEMKSKNEEMKSKNEEMKSKNEEMESKNEEMKSKNEEMKSLFEAAKEKNAECCSKIGEMEAKGMKNSESTKSQIQEMQNQKEKYKKLEESYEEQEGKLIEKNIALKEVQSKMMVGEQHITKYRKQISALENEKRENEKKIDDRNQELKRKFEIQKSQCKTIQEEKDTLEEELIAMKLEFKALMSERKKRELYEISSTPELQKLTNALKEVTDERDALDDKCVGLERENNRLKQLEQQPKVADEAEQLIKALDALNEENAVLRSRNHQLEMEISLEKSGKKQLECTIDELKEEIAKPKEKNANYSPGPRDDDPTKDLRQQNFQSTASTEQWYTTELGEKVLHEIFQKLMQPFPKTELSRDMKSKDIIIIVKRNHNNVSTIARFPRDFPKSPVHVKSGNKETRLKIPYDSSSTASTFSAHVVNVLCETICMQRE